MFEKKKPRMGNLPSVKLMLFVYHKAILLSTGYELMHERAPITISIYTTRLPFTC